VSSAGTVAELPLVGAGGEPVDFARTIVSHGVAELPPNRVDLSACKLETTPPIARGARTVRITQRGEKLRTEGSADPKLTRARGTHVPPGRGHLTMRGRTSLAPSG
jgi:hypothetical protein